MFTIGCDPELFVRNSDNVLIGAHDLVPGSKAAPFKVAGGAIQPDGLAAEFNTDPVPYADFEAFNSGIVGVISELKKVLPAGSKLAIEPSVEFEPGYYESVPENAKELGCDPDFCAYTADPFEPNPRPDNATSLRSAAGHIHIGWGSDIPADNPEHVEICRAFVKNLDVFVGLAMICIDGDTRRRELYGKAGAFRPKSYGVEYRTPSNAWLKSKGARRFIHGCVVKAISDMQKGAGAAYNNYGEGAIRSIINSGDVATAKQILSSLYISVPARIAVAS